MFVCNLLPHGLCLTLCSLQHSPLTLLRALALRLKSFGRWGFAGRYHQYIHVLQGEGAGLFPRSPSPPQKETRSCPHYPPAVNSFYDAFLT